MIGVGWFTVAMFTNNPLLDFGIDALYEYTHMPEWLDLLLVILYYVSLHFIASSWSKGRPLKLKNYTKQLIDGAFFLLCLGLVYFEPEEDWFAGAWSFGAYLHTVTVFGCLGYSRSFRFDDIFLAQLICRWVLVMSRGCSSHGKVLLLGVSLGLQLVKNFMREEFERGELEEKRFLMKNPRTCEDCHTTIKLISKITDREIVVS
ncbi:pentatricopeptide repeat (PPR) superfamily protein [Striga asiatica]|uniref:Pentatricopeptide repeat (PPR) superfamily protein n=1 Tax=Striga asiatica TaxID=4170 RepID=A0A5A7P1U1_STRAF|nr:pentatricopeptide repeat (PPR) superfamily protein [Striga asiatica]